MVGFGCIYPCRWPADGRFRVYGQASGLAIDVQRPVLTDICPMIPLPILKPRFEIWESLAVTFLLHWAPGVASTAGASLALVDLRPALNQVPHHSVSAVHRLPPLHPPHRPTFLPLS